MRIRPYRAGDLSTLVDLFHETVHAVGAGHYTQDELDAWAPRDLRPEDWAPRLEKNTLLVAEDDGELLGFAELSPAGAVDMLYVHKDAQGRGIASALLAELDSAARKSGLTRLTTTARSSFRDLQIFG